MLLTIGITTVLIALGLLMKTLREKGGSYTDLSLGDIGTHLAAALVPGIFGGMAILFVMTRFFPVNEIGHPFAPYFGNDLIYKVRIKTADSREAIGEAYLRYDRDPAEDECEIEVDKLVFNGRAYEIDYEASCCYYCLSGFGDWTELALVGRANVEVMLLKEKVGEW